MCSRALVLLAWLFELAGGAITDFENTSVPKSQREASFTIAALHQWEMEIHDDRCVDSAEEVSPVSCIRISVERSVYSPYLVDCRYLEASARWGTHPERKFYLPGPCTIATHEFIRFIFPSSSAGMSHPNAPKPVLAKTGPASARSKVSTIRTTCSKTHSGRLTLRARLSNQKHTSLRHPSSFRHRFEARSAKSSPNLMVGDG